MGRMNKRGELTSKQLVTIIILIISFVVILIFFFVINPKQDIDAESCRQSVILRGSPVIGESVKLNCKTEDVCISEGGKCAGVSDARIVKATSRQEVMEKMSELMYNCWWQMGEGKVDYAPKGWGFKEHYCAICARVKFDDKLKNEVKEISAQDFYNYLQARQTPNGEKSMLQYLYGIDSIAAVQAGVLAKTREQGYGEGIDIYQQKMFLSEENGYALITSETKQGWGGTVVGVAAGVGVAAIGIVAWPASVAVGTGAVIAGGAGLFGGFGGLFVSSGNELYIPPAYYPFNKEVLEKIQCDDFTTLP